MAIAALMGVGTAVKGEEVPSLDLNFNGQASSYTRATTSPTAPKANGDQLATDIVSCTRSTTATFMGSNGLIQTAAVNTPRVEYDASGNPLGLLVEEARTNYIGDSNDFSVSAWTKQTSFNIAADTSVSDPTGGSGAWKLSEGNSGTQQFTMGYAAYTPSANETTVLSVFARPISGANNELILTQWGEGYVSFDLSNGTVAYETGDETGEIVPAGNGWYRCILTTVETNSTASSYYILPGAGTFTSGSHIFTHGGDDVCHIFGAQVEVGKGATSYIPTSGGTTATRAADDISVSTSDFGYDVANSSTAIKASLASEPNSSFPRLYEYRGSSASYRTYGRVNNTNGSLQVSYEDAGPGVLKASNVATGLTYPIDATLVAANGGSDASFALNGDLTTPADLVSSMSTALTTLKLGGQVGVTTNTINGHIRRLRYWPRAINDAQLSKFTNQ